MNVVAFSRARFTPSDLETFGRIAEPRLQRGLWAGVCRQSGRDFDRLTITFPSITRPVFRFERSTSGTYKLLFNDRAGWYPIGEADNAAECLAVWRRAAC